MTNEELLRRTILDHVMPNQLLLAVGTLSLILLGVKVRQVLEVGAPILTLQVLLVVILIVGWMGSVVGGLAAAVGLNIFCWIAGGGVMLLLVRVGIFVGVASSPMVMFLRLFGELHLPRLLNQVKVDGLWLCATPIIAFSA